MIDLAQYAGQWAVIPSVGRLMHSRYEALLKVPPESVRLALEGAQAAAPSTDDFAATLVQRRGAMTEVRIAGLLSKRPMMSRSLFDSPPTYAEAARAVRMARDDESERVLMVIDSPGGSVQGLSTLLEAVGELRETKDVSVYVDDLAGSAAYWVAAAAGDEIVAPPLAYVGSIGTYVLLLDDSAAAEAAGLRFVLVSSGGVKGLGADGRVTDELVEYIQASVIDMTDAFARGIAAARGLTVPQAKALADGRTHRAPAALGLGLIDRIETLEQLRSRLAGQTQEATMSETETEKPATAGTDATRAEAAEQEPTLSARIRAELGRMFSKAPAEPAEEKEVADALAIGEATKAQNAELVALRETVAQLQAQAESRSKAEAQAKAEARVDGDLAKLADGVPPATLAKLRTPLVDLALAGKDEQYKALLEVATPMEFLGTVLAAEADSGERLAGDTRPASVRAVDEANGITPQRAAELRARYGADYRVDVN